MSIQIIVRTKSWKRTFRFLGAVIIGIHVPFAVYVLSSALNPEWKGACRNGWIDCCFIVTAAMRGHKRLVGPFTEVYHDGKVRLANRQLIVFWHLETLWSDLAPSSHNQFRCWYNEIGPTIAQVISHTYIADVVFLALKPAQWLATLVLFLNSAKSR